MKIRMVHFVTVTLASVALAGCATRTQQETTTQKVAALQAQVSHLQKALSGQGIMDIAHNQQQLQQQVASLQGQLQDLQHQLQQAQTREQNVDQSFDQRIAALEQGASANGRATSVSQGSSNAQGAASPATSTPGANESGGAQSDYQAYQAAFDKLKNGHNNAAVAAFKSFVAQHPNSRYVPNALYWTGAAYYVDGKYQEAIENFQKVIQNYPQSAKASDAYLKKANSQIGLKDYAAARATLQALIKRYPGSTAADVAKRLLSNMSAQGN